jgi:hypothetical protein
MTACFLYLTRNEVPEDLLCFCVVRQTFPNFQRSLLPLSSVPTLIMKATGSSETSVTFYLSTWRHVPDLNAAPRQSQIVILSSCLRMRFIIIIIIINIIMQQQPRSWDLSDPFRPHASRSLFSGLVSAFWAVILHQSA